MSAVVVQANEYWLSFLARDEARRLVAKNEFQMEPSLGSTSVALDHVDVVSIGTSECGYAIRFGHLEGRHFLVMTKCLEAS